MCDKLLTALYLIKQVSVNGKYTRYIQFYRFLSHREILLYPTNFARLTFYHTIPTFYGPAEGTFENNVETGEKLVTSIFSFSHNVFYPGGKKNQYLSYAYFVFIKCFQFEPV